MSNLNYENLITHLKEKKKKHRIPITTRIEGMRVTAFVQGTVKNLFLDDCIKRGLNESKVAAHIIETYYSAIDIYPDLKEKEPNAIKQFIIDRIKL